MPAQQNRREKNGSAAGGVDAQRELIVISYREVFRSMGATSMGFSLKLSDPKVRLVASVLGQKVLDTLGDAVFGSPEYSARVMCGLA